MLSNNDRDQTPQSLPRTPREHTLGDVPAAPTLPVEAESLLRHLNIGSSQSTPPPVPAFNGFPQIPNYEIEAEIGRGGMGVVYKARHLALRRTDAVKMILASAHATPGEVTRFMAEAEAIAAVKHPNVVQVYGLGDAEGRPYFVMELVEGGNLATLLKDGAPLAPTVAAELIADVAFGVQAAHEAGIVHRDLKPANILLAVGSGSSVDNKKSGPSTPPTATHTQSPFRPKVSDFGLAKRLASDLTRSQAVMGTPAYMAPEQAGKAKFVGPGADVYALGVLLYECLTGKVPFESPDAWSLIRQVLEDTPQSPRVHVPGVPRDLELICLKCLEKEPHDRYPTAIALATDLHRFLRGEPVSVRPIGNLKRVTRWAKRHPAPAALVVLVALLLLVVPPLLVWEQGRLDRHEAVADEARKKEDAAKQAEAEAKRAEVEAKRAHAESEKARIAAEKLAETQDLFALQTKMRNRAVARPVGWTQETRGMLPRGVALAGGDAATLTDLRSVAATTLLAPDLAPLDPILKGFEATSAATDPKTGLVAFGQFHAWAVPELFVREQLRVRLVDAATGKVVREFSFPASPARNARGEKAPDAVRSLAFSADGTRLFAGTRSSNVVRFDLDKPENTPAKQWAAAKSAIDYLAVSPDGKTVYGLCGAEKPVFAWSAETGQLITKLEAPDSGFHTFTVLPSGDVVAAHGHALYHWNAAGKLTGARSWMAKAVTNVTRRWDVARNLAGTAPRSIGMRMTATDSSMFLVSDGGSLEVYDRHGFDLIERYTDPTLRTVSHDQSVRNIVPHPSGAYAATNATDRDRAVKVWELSSGRLIGTVMSPGTTPIHIAWSGDGRYLLATSAKFVSRWRFSPAEPQRFACMNGNMVAGATFLPDGSVVTLGELRNGRRELNHELHGKRLGSNWLQDPGGNGREGLAGGPDGAVLATLDAPGLFYWKPGAPFPPLGFTQQIARCPRMSPDGKKIWAVVSSQEVHSFDPATGKLLTKWSNAAQEFISGLSTHDALAVSRNAVAAGCVNGSVYVLDPATGQPLATFPRPGDPVLSVAIAPDDSLVVAGTQGGSLRVINPVAMTDLPFPAHADGTTACAFNRDGTLLVTGGRDRSVKVWKRLGERFELLFAVADMPGAVREVQFNASDNRLLVLIAHGHSVRVWDIDKLRAQLAELKLGW